MKPVYQTSDAERADEVISVLAEVGIKTTLHGVHTSNLRSPRFIKPLTVWVLNDAEVNSALQALEHFYASESPPETSPAARSKPLRSFFWFAIAVLVAAVVATAAYGTQQGIQSDGLCPPLHLSIRPTVIQSQAHLIPAR